MNSQLAHIFDESTCLTKRQIRDYISGNMGREESHAVELHLNSCSFCSEAVEGLSEHAEEAILALNDFGTPQFLQDHLSKALPQVHLNSIAHAAAPVQSIQHGKNKNRGLQPVWRNTSIAAALILSIGLIWYWEATKDKRNVTMLAQQRNAIAQPEAEKAKVTSENTVASASPANQTPEKEKKQSEPQNSKSQKPPLLIASSKAITPAAEKEAGDTTESVRANAEKISDGIAAAGTKPQALREEIAMKDVQTSSAATAAPPPAMTFGNSYRNNNNLAYSTTTTQQYNVATNNNYTPALKKAKQDNAESRADALDVADAAYEKKYYNAALDQYKLAINNSTDKSRRYKAMLGAARCYKDLGQKKEAQDLLNKIIKEDSSLKDAAQSLLKELD